MKIPEYRIEFRNDIQYLRAISVLGVIGYHAPFEIFQGGWLGVDVFFVISGFLISNIIISDLFIGKFSFKKFYRRRIQRIAPALLATLALSSILATILLSEKALYEYSLSLRSSLFFYSNFHFLDLDIYNAEPGKYSPLLHMWSLAIEEQYYIIIPLIIFLLYRINKDLILTSFIVLFSSSFILSVFQQNTSKFYLLHLRAWELLLGTLALYIYVNFKFKYLNYFGFLIILYSFFTFSDNRILEYEPKLFVLVGVTMMLISETKINKQIINNLLKPLSLIGISSYSAYLLHQPVFAFYRQYLSINFQTYKRVELYKSEKVLLILTVLFLSYLFYIFIEKNFLKNYNRFKAGVLGSMTLLLLLFSFGYEQISDFKYSQGIETNNFYIEFKDRLRSYTRDLDSYSAYQGNQNCFDASLKETCIFNSSQKKEIVLLGDSHSIELGKLLVENIKEYKITILTGNNCMYILNKQNEEFCNGRNIEEFDRYISKYSNTIFVYHAFLNSVGYDEAYNLEKSLPETFEFLTENNNNLIVISPTPLFPYNPVDLYGNGKVFGDKVSISLKQWEDNKQNIKINKILDNSKNKRVTVIDSTRIFCMDLINDECIAAYNNSIYYRDSHHLTIEGAELIFKEIEKLLSKE
jgi:peptidoglycan/LPS O-acetylase OafA/YrhL